MSSIIERGEKLLRLSGAIEKWVIQDASQKVKQILDSLLVHNPRIQVEVAQDRDGVGNVRMSGGCKEQ